MKKNKLKRSVALAALKYIKPGTIIGIGTGSTISHFITELAYVKNKIEGAISSSLDTTNKLKYAGIKVFDLNDIDILPMYIDSADEINSNMQMIKGGGGALTHEKILAEVAEKFICIVDESKKVEILGKFPVPIEVIPMARSFITRELIKMGGKPKYRKHVFTDNGNIILDVHNLSILDPIILEKSINLLPGVVTVGIFAKRSADIALISTNVGIKHVFNKKR